MFVQVEISRVPREQLQGFMENKNRPHQGVVMRCSTRDYIPLTMDVADRLLAEATASKTSEQTGTPPTAKSQLDDVWVVLDEVHDPMNLGAIIRSCYFFGVARLIVCKKNTCPITPTVSKASSGAAELMKVAREIYDLLLIFCCNICVSHFRCILWTDSSNFFQLHASTAGQ